MYAMELRLMGGDPAMAANLEKHAQNMIAYQKKHGTKIPDMYKDNDEKLNLKKILDEMITRWRHTNKYSAAEFERFQETLSEYTSPDSPSICILMKSDLKEDSVGRSFDDLLLTMFNEDAQLQVSKSSIALYIRDSSCLTVLKYEL